MKLFPSFSHQPIPPSRPFQHASDPALLNACADGDQRALLELIARYGARLRYLATRVGLSPQDAEDIVQEVFLALFQQNFRLAQPEYLRVWLMATAKRRIYYFLRRTQPVPPLPDYTPASEAPFERIEQEYDLRRAVSRLGRTEKAIVILILENRDISAAEIAARLGLQPSSVKVLRSTALKHLRRLLEEDKTG